MLGFYGIKSSYFYKYSEITQAQIGRLIGDIDYVSLHYLRKRFREKIRENSKMRKIYQKAEVKLRANMQNA